LGFKCQRDLVWKNKKNQQTKTTIWSSKFKKTNKKKENRGGGLFKGTCKQLKSPGLGKSKNSNKTLKGRVPNEACAQHREKSKKYRGIRSSQEKWLTRGGRKKQTAKKEAEKK